MSTDSLGQTGISEQSAEHEATDFSFQAELQSFRVLTADLQKELAGCHTEITTLRQLNDALETQNRSLVEQLYASSPVSPSKSFKDQDNRYLLRLQKAERALELERLAVADLTRHLEELKRAQAVTASVTHVKQLASKAVQVSIAIDDKEIREREMAAELSVRAANDRAHAAELVSLDLQRQCEAAANTVARLIEENATMVDVLNFQTNTLGKLKKELAAKEAALLAAQEAASSSQPVPPVSNSEAMVLEQSASKEIEDAKAQGTDGVVEPPGTPGAQAEEEHWKRVALESEIRNLAAAVHNIKVQHDMLAAELAALLTNAEGNHQVAAPSGSGNVASMGSTTPTSTAGYDVNGNSESQGQEVSIGGSRMQTGPSGDLSVEGEEWTMLEMDGSYSADVRTMATVMATLETTLATHQESCRAMEAEITRIRAAGNVNYESAISNGIANGVHSGASGLTSGAESLAVNITDEMSVLHTEQPLKGSGLQTQESSRTERRSEVADSLESSEAMTLEVTGRPDTSMDGSVEVSGVVGAKSEGAQDVTKVTPLSEFRPSTLSINDELSQNSVAYRRQQQKRQRLGIWGWLVGAPQESSA